MSFDFTTLLCEAFFSIVGSNEEQEIVYKLKLKSLLPVNFNCCLIVIWYSKILTTKYFFWSFRVWGFGIIWVFSIPV